MAEKRSYALMFGTLLALGVTPATGQAPEATEVRFTVGHIDCSGGSASFEFFVDGTSVGTFSPTQGCVCGQSPLVVTLNDSATLSAVGPVGCTIVAICVTGFNLSLAYARAEIDRPDTGTEVLCVLDANPSIGLPGSCSEAV